MKRMNEEKDDDALGPFPAATAAGSGAAPRPVRAQYEPERHVFWLTRKKGKRISNGGFGIVLPKIWRNDASKSSDQDQPTDSQEPAVVPKSSSSGNANIRDETTRLLSRRQDNNRNDNKEQKQPKPLVKAIKSAGGSGGEEEESKESAQVVMTSEEYLNIEEVLYLFERGVLDVVDDHDKPMELHRVYALLNADGPGGRCGCGMSLPVYLTYAHLRQQSFRVVRHSPERRRILLVMQEQQQKTQERIRVTASTKKRSNPSDEGNIEDNGNNNQPRRSFDELKRDLREASAKAVPPPIAWMNDVGGDDGGGDGDDTLWLRPAWDVYPPDQNFSRSAPGLPAFSVLVTSYSQGMISFAQIAKCFDDNHPIPIKIATVSDGGIVVLFGVSNEGIPPVSRK